MKWAQAALAGGLLVLLAAFAIGTEHDLSTSVMGQTRECGPAISASWLVSGSPDKAGPGLVGTGPATACGPTIRTSRVLVLTVMGAGGLLALVGWTAMSTRREDVPRTGTHARA